MINKLGKWIEESHPTTFTIYTFDDLLKIDYFSQDLIEGLIRKRIISMALESPSDFEANLTKYLTICKSLSERKLYIGIESTANFKIVLEKIINKFELCISS